jgi:hypothetical protein
MCRQHPGRWEVGLNPTRTRRCKGLVLLSISMPLPIQLGGKAIESVLSQKTGLWVMSLMRVHRANRIRPREMGRPG